MSCLLVQKVLELSHTSTHLKLLAMTNLGVAYEVTGDILSALHWFNRVLRFIGNEEGATLSEDEKTYSHVLVLVHMSRSKMTACVWDESESSFDHLLHLVLDNELLRGKKPSPLLPFDTLMHQMSPQTRKQIAMTHTNQFRQTHVGLPKQVEMPPLVAGSLDSSELQDHDEEELVKRLTVGYISYDFADHPTAHLLKGLFATTDRERTKVVAFGYGRDDASQIRRELKKVVGVFEEIANRSIQQSVAIIQSHQVHILMDAQVHTRGSRMAIIARRPAPIVVNYLVYPGTSGAAFVDYLITDRHVVPAELADGFTEKLVFLPHSYQVNAYDLDQRQREKLWEHRPGAAEGSEGDYNDAFVFVNFNKADKIEPSVFAMWMAILRRVPKGVLLLLDPAKNKERESVTSREMKNNIVREAEAQGVLRSRIRFLPRCVMIGMLIRLLLPC